MRSLPIAAAMLTIALQAFAAEPPRIAVVEAERTQFKVTLTDGTVLRSRDLVGAVLRLSGGAEIRIDSAEHDPADKTGTVWLHRMSARGRDGRWHDLCMIGPDGKAWGFPLAGTAGKGGVLVSDDRARFDIVCAAGARAKCIRFGYRPWDTGADGASMLPVYNACVRMVRADYCGDGAGTTRNGMPIDMYDVFGIQRPDNLAEHDFEAGWGPDGAVCVRHVRVKENTSLDALARSCPRLATRLGPNCTEDSARAAGALLFNRSQP